MRLIWEAVAARQLPQHIARQPLPQDFRLSVNTYTLMCKLVGGSSSKVRYTTNPAFDIFQGVVNAAFIYYWPDVKRHDIG